MEILAHTEQLISNIKLNKTYCGVGLIEKGLAINLNDIEL